MSEKGTSTAASLKETLGEGVPENKEEKNTPEGRNKTSTEQPNLDDTILTLVDSAATGLGPPVVGPTELNQGDNIDDPVYATGIKLVFALVSLNLSILLIFLDNSILSTAIPTITDAFHSTQDIGWYVSSYQLALSVLQPSTGKLFTYLTNKWTYIFFMVIFELGSLICGLANSSNMLIAGRTVAGLGASGLYNGALTIISGLVPLQKRPLVTGILMGFGQLGLIGGPLIGGSLTQYATWRWCFFINLPIGGLAIILLAIVHIPDQRRKSSLMEFFTSAGVIRRLDLVGTAILAPAIIMVLLALEFGGNNFPWHSATIIGLFCGFGVTILLFIVWEWRVAREDALFPVHLLREKVVTAGALTNLCLFSCTYISAYFVPIYFQSIRGDSAFTSGVHSIPGILSQMFMAVFSGFGVSKLGYYLPWSIFSAVGMSIGSGLVSTWSSRTSTADWIGYQIIFGVGRGAGLQMALVAQQTVIPDSQIASVMSFLVFVQGLGGSIFITIANTIFDNHLVSEIHSKAPDVNTNAILAAGATGFRKIVPENELAIVVNAYASSFDHVFYLAIGLSVATFFSIWGLGWNDVRKTRQQKSQSVTPEQNESKKNGDDNV